VATLEASDMPRKNGRKGLPRKRVYFRIHAPEASRVALVGSFGVLGRMVRFLKRCRKGFWKTYLLLEPGTYDYRFIVEGERRDDPVFPEANGRREVRETIRLAV
jgi:1,4-alpha-glucan branching enzyme